MRRRFPRFPRLVLSRRRAEGGSSIRIPGVASYRFEGNTVRAIPEATRDRVLEVFRANILPMFLQSRGMQVLHASAVRLKRGVVAFAGRPGVGKSTLAEAFARQGGAPWADDALLFTPSPRGVVTWSLTGSRVPRVLRAVCLLQRGRSMRVTRLIGSRAYSGLLEEACSIEAPDRRLIRQYLELASAVPVLRVRFRPGRSRLQGLVLTILKAVQ